MNKYKLEAVLDKVEDAIYKITEEIGEDFPFDHKSISEEVAFLKTIATILDGIKRTLEEE